MKPNSIDLGLAISALHSRIGVPRDHRDIAAYCDCSWQRIWQIEQKALRKIRIKLHCDKVLLDALQNR